MVRFGARLRLTSALWLLASGACLGISGCVSLDRGSEEARTAFIGTGQRTLLNCLGPPDDVSFHDERSYFLYNLRFRLSGAPTPTALARPAFCNLLFEMDRGSVSDLEVAGRSFDGHNAASRCAVLAADRCLEIATPAARVKPRGLN